MSDVAQMLHKTLMAYAEAVEQNNIPLAEDIAKPIKYLAALQKPPTSKVATYFAEALARRILGMFPQHSASDSLQNHFYKACPYLKVAHFTANQAILEAFQGKSRVHVIDFSINEGIQWQELMRALALRPGGPHVFRLTGVGSLASDNSDHLQQVGWKLAQLAQTFGVEFKYRRVVVNSLADLEASMLELRSPETESVAVNSVFELHKLNARPGSLERVFSVIRQIQPEIVTVVEQEANHNGSSFLDRFTESLYYYSALFDSLESSLAEPQDKAMSEVYLGKQICNVVACEGTDRVERHETLNQWRNRFGWAGFSPVHLGSNVLMRASLLLSLFGGEGYKVEENDGCLMHGWNARPLIVTSAWKLAADNSSGQWYFHQMG
ncbi:unnamed protein product [Trifolium pratense]|uniref:Uncharacterized protein n=1 Tax=Trifolium pratense TaxID=57577 RepID=A0ACB0MB57_TRIPR|nr:unnamed protein product [Trifolium pratense]